MLNDDLKKAANKSGLTIYALAKLAKVSEPTVHRWLKEEGNLRMSNAEKIAAALNLELKPKSKPKTKTKE